MSSKNQKSILVVDDEPDILEIISYNLIKAGYTVNTASNGKEALSKLKKKKPDLIIIDVMMPELDGIETCTQVREKKEYKDIVVVFLSARSEEFSQLAAYEAGADDYVVKPVKPKILVSKIAALLKLKTKEKKEAILKFGKLIINKDNYTVIFKEEEITLPKKEFELLYLLASEPKRVFQRDEILEKVWGNEVVVGGRTIDVHIRKLRERFGDKKLKTIKGVGYKFNE